MATIGDDLNSALTLHRAGRLDLAIPLYRRIADNHPAHVEAHKMLAVALFADGRHGDAERAARAALALKPASPDGANILAVILRQTERADEAVRVLQALGPRIRNFPGININLALALSDLGRDADARAAFRNVLARDPANEDALLGLAALDAR